MLMKAGGTPGECAAADVKKNNNSAVGTGDW